MTTDLPLACSCGSVRGVLGSVGPGEVNRLSCYCDDCQAWARFLGQPERIYDAHGGTDLSQASVARVSFTEGLEHVACARLTEKGLFRWYTSCCRTPIGNTMPSARWPFVGVIHTFVDHASDGRDRTEVLGPVVGVQGRFAIGDRTTLEAHARAPAGVMFGAMWRMLGWWWRGDSAKSPFFDAEGKPVVEPTVLTAEELRKARST